MKIIASDLLAILRKFEIASDSNVPREIDQIRQSHPNPTNQLVTFRFGRRKFYVLVDDTAEDDQAHIWQQLQTADSNIDGTLLKNPSTHVDTFGLPYKGKDIYLFEQTVDRQRLDIYLAETHPETSRSTWQKHIKQGRVLVNGAATTAPRYEISPADTITLDLPDAPDHSTQTLPILYLDDDVIVVDKPIGILTHAKSPLDDEFTVAEFFRRYTTEGLDTDRPGIVHRLDRDTSGVIIGARTPASYEHLKAQFSERHAQKTYLAIIDGHLPSSPLKIDIPIGRNPTKPGSFRSDPHGKPAETTVREISRHGDYSLIELQPKTGRTHQLRVHMQHLGTPIHGDRLYGMPSDRLSLHAYQLTIALPGGATQTFTSPQPPEFNDLLAS